MNVKEDEEKGFKKFLAYCKKVQTNKDKNRKVLIEDCKVEHGLFDSERLVTFNTADGLVQSLVSRDLINGKTLKVDFIKCTHRFCTIRVPGDLLQGSRLMRLHNGTYTEEK